MTPEEASALRAPFPAELIGKLPRIWCMSCRDAKSKVCSEHAKVKCEDCGNKLTTAHLHLDYAGHADVTDRLLQVDPGWSWEPAGVDAHGLPVIDANGGLWLRLTVCGTTRLGYGHADGKRGGDAVKEAIGDGLRNAALRFGVGLDLWRKERPPVDDGGPRAAPRERARPAAAASGPKMISEPQLRKVMALMNQSGITDRAARLRFCSEVAGRDLGSSNDLTQAEAGGVIEALEAALADDHSEAPA